MPTKFSIVGGASAYAPGLVNALIDESERHELEQVRLFDIDADRLATVGRLCRKMARARGEPFEVVATTDPVEAVRGVDVLLNSSRPGGFECRKIDETLPLEFGVPGQETVGPGGFFFALRSVPAALELASTVSEHAPEAIWLNYTNPTNIVSQALYEQTDLAVIALCDQSEEDLGAIGAALGLDRKTPYEFECSGLNHATWYRHIRLGGEPLDERALAASPPDYYDEEHRMRFRFSCELAKRHDGAWPNSYLPYYVWPEAFVELARRQGTRTDVILEGLGAYYEHFREQAERDEPELRRYRGSHGFGDMAVDVLSALNSKQPEEIVLNVANQGLSEDFDAETVVEAHVELSQDGLARRPAPPVPPSQRPLLAQLEEYQRRTARAAVGGGFEQMTAALAANPLVDGSAMAEKMLERARKAYGDHLPQLEG